MGTFLKNSAIFILIIFGFQLLVSISLPYYYGNELYAEKLDYFNENKDDFNAVIFGSSRLYRQLNPVLLDSLLESKKISSFNFATGATHNPESYILYEEFINNLDNNRINLAIVELQSLVDLPLENLVTVKGNYWSTISSLNYCNSYIIDSDFKELDKQRIKVNYLKSFKSKYFSFRSSLISFFNDSNKLRGIRGFYSFENNMNDEIGIDNNEIRFNSFQKDTTKIIERIEQAKVFESLHLISNKLNRTHLDLLNHLLKVSQNKGIHLIFVIPPRLENYNELIPIYNNLSNKNIIEIANYNKYKELYRTVNSFDIGHLNNSGSNLFTTYFAEELMIRFKDEI